jgi:transcriptional regulator with XRE-family HTH domain
MDEIQLYIKVGQKIKQARESKGLTQQELAYICNMEKSNISRIESGRTNLTLKSLYQLSKALSVSLKLMVDID